MREIKFRCWYKHDEDHSNEMEYLTLQEVAESGNIGDDHDDFIWMQYTGLKDKNGKEIYEGDVTALDESDEYNAIIRWNKETASFVADSIKGDCVSSHLYGAGLCEIIGNIHENPELLGVNNG
jgi:uncharacterized phage protein (TIGR01671 family)